jgi:multiple sugar transport system substrate-binding protein
MNRLRIRSMTAAGLLSLIVAACSSAASPAPATTEPTESAGATTSPSPSAAAPVALAWWDYYSDAAQTDAINAAIQRYEDAHPGVTIERTSFAQDELLAKLTQGAATNTLPDIIILPGPFLISLAPQGIVADISRYTDVWSEKDAYAPGAWDSSIYQGKQYGIPFTADDTGLFYNKTLLDAAGIASPPATMDELRTTAKKLTSGNQFGLCLSAASNGEGVFTFLPFLWAAGGDVPTIGDAASIKALTLWHDFFQVDKSVSPDMLNTGQFDLYPKFINGQCAMMINGPWMLPSFEADKDRIDFNWSVAPWPKDVNEVSILGGESFALTPGPNMDAGWDVISWLSQPDQLREMLKAHGPTRARLDLGNDPSIASDPIVKTFQDLLAVGRSTPYGPNFLPMVDVMSTMIQEVGTGSKTPEAAAADAATSLAPLLAQ